jgi:pyruvate/2-oxoacid:ferredoxin oxidoreductase alpha subunit
VVLAPSSVEDCFYTAIEAVNIARKYNVPVFILSDQSIATRIEAFVEPDLKQCCQDLTPDFSPAAQYTPYPLDGRVELRLAPGTPILNGIYPVATGLEHDEMGHPTGSPSSFCNWEITAMDSGVVFLQTTINNSRTSALASRRTISTVCFSEMVSLITGRRTVTDSNLATWG